MSRLTDSQQQAIKARGNVLVVAGAGTGKTSTLVHRCVSLLLEENCSLDEILMVTFTEAAAAEMRSRIRAELLRLQESLPEESRESEQVQKQIALLDTAHICTLHSFCLQLIRSHFYQLGLDPAILVLDERQSAPLMSQTLEALFNRYYASDTVEASEVHELIRELGGGSDERIRSRLVRLHRYTQALDDPEDWLAKQQAMYQEEEPVAWYQWFETGFDQWRKVWLPELKPFAHVPAVRDFIKALTSLSEKPTRADTGEALQKICEANQQEQNWPRGTKTETGKALRSFLADVEFLASSVPGNTRRPEEAEAPPEISFPTSAAPIDPLEQDWQWVRPHVCTLLRLTREFSAAFSKAKRELGGLDFSDLEQFALRLLRDPAIARQWQERLRFIFVDECQDINRAQDAIITALSREETQPNRFLVGDVKQSIYRFRLANPKIFCEYEERWREPGRGGARIPLADNFRSRKALLDFVNPLFAALMRAEVGGIGYEPDVHLRFGSAEERQQLLLPGARVELHLIDQTDKNGENAGASEEQCEAQAALLDLMSVEREARLVALRLRELREQQHSIWDQETAQFRSVEWRDLVVLMRSPAGKAEAFAKEFNRAGVPLSAARSGFFESLEISDLLSLLKLIDNPLQDVPLLAVLRSPLAGFSLDELVEIRAHNREKPFWVALRKFQHERGGSPKSRVQGPTSAMDLLSNKVEMFLRQFDGWRELARQSSLSQCLEAVLTGTHYEALLLAETRGEERVANVRRLLELAREYDPYQRQGLYRFLRFVAAQEEAEVEMEPASAQTENAVRLMSIHKSKGLEFPVVILAGLGGQFNVQDLRQDLLLHETYGLCSKVKPPNADESYPSLPYWLARRDEQRELLGEELRLLYVALTRARDTLILTGTCKGPRWLKNSAASPSGLITDRQVLSARSYLDWLLLWLPEVTTTADWSSDREGQTALLRWKTYAANDPQLLLMNKEENSLVEIPTLAGELDEVELLKLQERLLWKYPFSAATVESAVKRVSTLIWEQAEALDESQLLFNYDPSPGARSPAAVRKRPASTMAAVDIGSAHHRFLEMVSLERVSELAELKQEAAQMLSEGNLKQNEVEALDFNALREFWRSEIGKRILSQAPNVHREIPFTARFSPEDFATLNLCSNAADLAGEYFVVRGQADLAVLLPREIWLLDFKTDQVTEPDSDEKARQYAPQLKLYALGLSRIYRRPVTHRWLHFLALGKTVSV